MCVPGVCMCGICVDVPGVCACAGVCRCTCIGPCRLGLTWCPTGAAQGSGLTPRLWRVELGLLRAGSSPRSLCGLPTALLPQAPLRLSHVWVCTSAFCKEPSPVPPTWGGSPLTWGRPLTWGGSPPTWGRSLHIWLGSLPPSIHGSPQAGPALACKMDSM